MKNKQQLEDLPTIIGKVIEFDSSGCGHVITDDSKNYSVPYTIPGEKISFKAMPARKKTIIDEIKILNTSEDRTPPDCQHFGTCGGCSLQHLTPAAYKEFKISKVKRAMIENNVGCENLQELKCVKPSQRWRANFEGIKTPQGFRLGFHKRQSHHIIDIQECHTMGSNLFKIISAFKPIVSSIMENYQKTQVVALKANEGIDLWFDIQGQKELDEKQIKILKEFAKKNNLARLVFRYRKRRNFIHTSKKITITINGLSVPIRATDFLQSGAESQELLTKLVIDNLKGHKLTKVVDLFCGLGTFSLPLSRIAQVDAYEFSERACSILKEVSQANNLPITTAMQNLFDEPLTTKELNKYDAVIIDPPRAGAASQCAEIAKSKVPYIIYVSCHLESLIKDSKSLIVGGYKMQLLTPVDQFPYTPHLECIAYFTKG